MHLLDASKIRCILTNCISDTEFAVLSPLLLETNQFLNVIVYKFAFKHADLLLTKLTSPDILFFYWNKVKVFGLLF